MLSGLFRIWGSGALQRLVAEISITTKNISKNEKTNKKIFVRPVSWMKKALESLNVLKKSMAQGTMNIWSVGDVVLSQSDKYTD